MFLLTACPFTSGLWEIVSALSLPDDVKLSVVLPPAQKSLFRTGIRKDCDSVVQALSDMQAEKADAYDPHDKAMIMEAIRGGIGFAKVNQDVKAFLRDWYIATTREIAASADGDEKGDYLQVAALILKGFGLFGEALAIHQEVLAFRIATVGENDAQTGSSDLKT